MKEHLSPVQTEIIKLMGEGWELGHYKQLHPHVTIQKNGLGRGGDTKTVSFKTFELLLNKNIIFKTSAPKFKVDVYSLTEVGKSTFYVIKSNDLKTVK